MAAVVIDITDYDYDDDADAVTFLFAIPGKKKLGSSKKNAISVENYRRTRTNRIIDLTYYNDDEVEILSSLPPKRFHKGESSNSNSVKSKESVSIPITSMCEICADEKPSTDMFKIMGCDHSYCSECMSKYVASKLQDNVTNISCPVSDCVGVLEPYHCRSILPKQVFDRWGDALCEAVILSAERFYCPYKDCSALFIDDGNGGSGEAVCPYCNRMFCVQCKVSWHAGITCEEFRKLDKNERSNEDLMLMQLAKSQNWQRCPKCRFYVEKSQGCLFMRCRCGFGFCYHCAAPLTAHYCTNCKR